MMFLLALFLVIVLHVEILGEGYRFVPLACTAVDETDEDAFWRSPFDFEHSRFGSVRVNDYPGVEAMYDLAGVSAETPLVIKIALSLVGPDGRLVRNEWRGTHNPICEMQIRPLNEGDASRLPVFPDVVTDPFAGPFHGYYELPLYFTYSPTLRYYYFEFTIKKPEDFPPGLYLFRFIPLMPTYEMVDVVQYQVRIVKSA